MRATREGISTTDVLVFSGIGFVIIFTGFGIAVSPIYFAIFSLIPIFVILACWQFRIAVLVMLLFASGLIPRAFTPTIPFFGGAMRTEDLFLIMLGIISMFRLIMQSDSIKNNSLWFPLYFFTILVIFSLFIAFGYKNKPRLIFTEFRTIMYWFYAFLLVVSIKREEHLRTATNFIIVLSVFVSVAVIIQSFADIQILNNSRLEKLLTVTDVNYDINRSTFGGTQGFAVFSLVLVLARVSRRDMPPILAVPTLIIIAFALLVTFGRGVWAMSFMVVFIASVWLGWKSFFRIWGAVFLVVAIIGSTSFVVKPDLFDAAVSRATSVGHELEKGGSWGWRRMEIDYGTALIKKYPIRGIGLGGEFMPSMNKNMHEDHTAICHNSYMYLALKFGLLGLLFPVWLCVTMLLKAKNIGDPLAIAVGSAFLNPIVIGYTQMEWANMYGVLFMATMVGLLVAHDHLTTVKKLSATGSHPSKA